MTSTDTTTLLTYARVSNCAAAAQCGDVAMRCWHESPAPGDQRRRPALALVTRDAHGHTNNKTAHLEKLYETRQDDV